MRYSMLVYLTEMGRTLLEAAEYLAGSPENDPAREELLENGRRMMEQIRAELERHRRDLKSDRPVGLLNEAKERWGGEDCAALIRQWIQCLPEEVRYQVRAVFLADLGEKWDSLDSVYRFMRDDPRFDPVVVLIPYIRADPKNIEAKAEAIYKNYLTPMGIPFLEYNQYNMKEDCPDLAFTSQPYDAVLLPEFRAKNIAQYTRLVYLPYFLPYLVYSGSITTYAQMEIYSYAWRVVCSSEKHYDFYCRYSAHKGANALLTGIPKLDGLVDLPNRGIKRPKGWEILEGKTVVLWNSWFGINVSSFRFFDDLLHWFELHPDCVLLWRMHPLTDTVAKVQLPGLYQDFLEKVRRAEAAPNVVIDRETSFHAAFYYSDALISDFSSLLPQYLLMDKPALMVRNLEAQFTGEEFVENTWVENAGNAPDILAFLERICAGKDRKAAQRKTIRRRDLSLADGHSAERICEALWTDLHRETLG